MTDNIIILIKNNLIIPKKSVINVSITGEGN